MNSLQELERREIHAKVVADATYDLFEKSMGGKTFADVLRTKEEAKNALGALKRFHVYMRAEKRIENACGCTLEGRTHVAGLRWKW
jgi:hypothetical protein